MVSLTLNACAHCGFDQPQMTDTSTRRALEPSIAVLSLVICPADIGGCGSQSGWYDDDNQAAMAWNRRAEPELVSKFKDSPLGRHCAAMNRDVATWPAWKLHLSEVNT